MNARKMEVLGMCISLLVILLFVPSSYAAIDPATVVGAWLFDDGSGTLATDSSDNGNDGTLTGCQWVDGIFGKALEFNGASDWVNIPEIGTYEQFTVAAWVNSTGRVRKWRAIFNNDGWSPGDVHHQFYPVGDEIGFSINGSPGGEHIKSDFAFDASQIGVWRHVATVYNSNEGWIRFYIDGELDVERQWGGDPAVVGPGRIGAWDEEHREFQGMMDEVVFLSAVLEQGDVQYLMDYGLRRSIGDVVPTGDLIVDNLGDMDDGNPYTAADGTNTLRKCIRLANDNVGADTIDFGVSGTIFPTSPLPPITDDGTIIDASLQWIGAWPSGQPGITLDGVGAEAGAEGLRIFDANNCHIRGLFITNFGGKGILIGGAQLNTVGGAGVGARNVISGNGEIGVEIGASDNNVISGNYIGTDVTGTTALGNSEGVWIGGAQNIIGGTTESERNVISGNGNGVEIRESSTGNVVSGNYIGTDVTGTADLGNAYNGVTIDDRAQSNTIGGTNEGERNIISGNDGNGVSIDGPGADSNKVSGNYIGTDVTGTIALGNTFRGVRIEDGPQLNTIGGITQGERNIISGNSEDGVAIIGSGTDNNVVSGNYIGTDVHGVNALGNLWNGVRINGPKQNVIGGATPGERNIISGNMEHGVFFHNSGTDNNAVKGNFIGVDVTGAADLGNAFSGIALGGGAQSNVIGGTTAGERNIISGNNWSGVISGDSGTDKNVISGNYIGTDVTGTIALGNSLSGIIMDGGQWNIIGGATEGERNIIAFNYGHGIAVEGAGTNLNTISGNSIHDNDDLGINLSNGGNDEITPPDIIWASLADDTLTIAGDAAGDGGTVEVFKADSSGLEGQIFLGSLTANWGWRFSGSLSVIGKGISIGDDIVTTTTHTNGNTSGFSSSLPVSEDILSARSGHYQGHYYEVIIESIYWDDAKVAAEGRTFNGLQGHLAAITSQDENDFITGILPFDGDFWIGGFQPPGSPEPDGNWQWVTGEPFDYTNWAEERPNNLSPDEARLQLWPGGEWDDAIGWLNPVPGGWAPLGYIVEYESDKIPSHDWTIEYNGSVLPENADPPWSPWSGGTESYASTDGDILTIDTRGAGCGEQQYTMVIADSPAGFTLETRAKIGAMGNEGEMADTVIEIFTSTKHFALAFLPDRIAESIDDTPWDELVYYYLMDTTSDFHVYQITLENGVANVYVDGVYRLRLEGFQPEVLVDPGNVLIVWGDVVGGCEGMNGLSYWDYVNIDESQGEVTGPVLNPANGHYYEVVAGHINWDDAKAAAEGRTFNGLQGHLATITSQDENDFLLSIRPPSDTNFRIGGFQPPGSPEPGGNWQWVTGEPFVYQNWAQDEPSNSYGDEPNEDSLEFPQNGEWNDLPGIWENSSGYIVEYEPRIIPSHAWTIEYDGSVLPENADPPWSASLQGSASTDGDILTINTTGVDCGESQYEIGGNTTSGITVEARVKIGAIGSAEVIPDTAIEIFTSTQAFVLVFLEDRIAQGEFENPWNELDNHYLMDTTSNFHVYRITMQDGVANVYVDGVHRLTSGFQSENPVILEDVRVNWGEVRWGCGGMNGLSYWDYVKIDTNVAEPPPAPRMLSITSVEASPGDQVTVQLSISDATGLISGNMTIKYDASVITVGEIRPMDLLSGMLMIANTNVPGEIKLASAGVSGIPSGGGALVEIDLTVNADAEMDTETALTLDEVTIYDEQGSNIPVSLENGVVRIKRLGVKGDVDGNGEVNAYDATLTLQISAEVLIPTEYQLWAADMNNDGDVNASDATPILRAAVGLGAPGIGTWRQGDMEIGRTASLHITVGFGEAHGITGERIAVPVRVDSTDILASGDICIAYDSAVLRAVDVSSDSGLLLASNTTEPGILRIAFASASGLNSQTIAGIQFDVLADTSSLLKFRTVELYGIDARRMRATGIDRKFRPWAQAPEHNSLLQNFPNPFNPETWIPYQLAEDSEVKVTIYSATGQLVRTIDLGYREAGSYVTRETAPYWDGTNEVGEAVASGIYFYTIQAGDYTATRKMTARK